MSDSVSGRKKFDVGTRQSKTVVSSSDICVHNISAECSVRSKESKTSSVYKSSEEYFEYSCDPCKSAGDHLEAEGFCIDCDEYLCGTCFKSHYRGKVTRNHTLLKKDAMPRKSVKICDPCKTAREAKDVEGYCDDCEEYLCENCFKSHSRSKATRHHNLIDKNNMPEKAEISVESSFAGMDIEHDRDYQKYNEEYTYIRNINVKVNGDEKNCYIVAMTLVSNSNIVLADNDNRSLKVVDIERSLVQGTMILQSEPFGLATISKDQVAVTLPNIYQIQIITVHKNLSVQRTIKVMGQCLDIKHLNGKFYVSFTRPVQFQILQPSGAVHKTIIPDSNIIKHCPFLRYIAVSPYETVIYASDWVNNKVMSIDMKGNLKCVYQGELDMPCDIVISSVGSLYLCNGRKRVVNRMRRDLSEAVVKLGPGDGLGFPLAFCFNAYKQHMYISDSSASVKYCNFIKVFKWQ